MSFVPFNRVFSRAASLHGPESAHNSMPGTTMKFCAVVTLGHGPPSDSRVQNGIMQSARMLFWKDASQTAWQVLKFKGKVGMHCAGHKNAVLELHWTSDGEHIVSASPDKSVRAWDAATGEQVKKMSEHDNFVNSCCPLKRGPPLLVSGSDDGTAKVATLYAALCPGFSVYNLGAVL